MSYNWELLKIMFYFILIVAIIIILAKIMRRYLNQQRQGKHLRVIEQLYLGQKSYLSLIKVKDKILLISIGKEKVQKISEWPLSEFGDINIKEKQEIQGKFKDILLNTWRDSNDE